MARFGETLRRERQWKRKTLKDIADHLAFSTVYISDIERGRRGPLSFHNIAKLRSLLGLGAVNNLIKARCDDKNSVEFALGNSKPKDRMLRMLRKNFHRMNVDDLEALNAVLTLVDTRPENA